MPTACRGFDQLPRELQPVSDPASSPGASAITAEKTCIDGPLTIAEVGRWHALLVSRLTETGALSLDLTGMTAVDAIGLQLLCAARRTAVAEGKFFNLSGAGEAFFATCEAAGIAPTELGVTAKS